MNIFMQIAACACLVTLVGCTDKGGPPADTSTSENPKSMMSGGRIEIPPAVRNNLGITFAKVQRRWVNDTIRIPGSFELMPLARREYRMPLPGRVRLLVDQYQTVRPGDVLFTYQSERWQQLQEEILLADQAVDTAAARLAVESATLTETRQRMAILRDRIQRLAEADFKQAGLEARSAELGASIPGLLAKVRQAETALANTRQLREQSIRNASVATGITEQSLLETVMVDGVERPAYMDIEWLEVRAEETGIVQVLDVTNGAHVLASDMVLSTIDPEMVRFRASALQSDLPRLGDGLEAWIVPPMTDGLRIDDGVSAAVTIGLEADPQQRTVAILARPEESRPWIRPGVSAFLELVVDSTDGPALAIPRAAVLKDGIVHVFFRRDPKDANQAIRVEADMGIDDGRWIQIRSGIGPDDQVVLDGAYELKLATQQHGGTGKGGHFHADGTFHEDH